MNNDKRKIGTCPGGRELGLRRCHVRGTGGHAPRLLEVPEGSQVPGPVPVGIAPAEMPQTCRMGRGREGARAATAGSVRHCRVGNGDALPQGCEPAGGLSRASCCAAVKRTLRLAMRGSRRSPARPVLWEHTRAHTRIRVHTPHTRSLRKGQDINTSRAPTMGQEKRPCFPAIPVRPRV